MNYNEIKKELKNRTVQWKTEMNSNRNNAIKWAIKEGIVEKEPETEEGVLFLLGETYSRAKAKRALQKLPFVKDIKQMGLRHQYDFVVTTTDGDVMYIEDKHRLYDFYGEYTYRDILLDAHKYNELNTMENIYYMNTYYDGNAAIWPINDYSRIRETKRPLKTVVDADFITEDGYYYDKDKALKIWKYNND